MAVDLIAGLLQTQALRVAPPGQVFWYTSGTIGPYYINTHYLYGGREQAEELLAFIDAEATDRTGFPARLRERVLRQVDRDPVYRAVVEGLTERVRGLGGGEVDWVSGGERRDWFFSAAVAEGLVRPHLLLYKDLSAVLTEAGKPLAGPLPRDRQTAHVADLVTEASSYLRAWIPAMRGLGCEMSCSVNVVDRGQGGLRLIEEAGVKADALVKVDEELFAFLRRQGHVDGDQEALLVAYYRDPVAAMREFLLDHPDFLPAALASADPRTATRARMLVEQNPYGLDLSGFKG